MYYELFGQMKKQLGQIDKWFDAATAFDTSGFLNPVAGTFGWSLDPAGHTLSLVYTPTAVPEPGTLVLLGAAAAAGWGLRRRHS